MGRQNRAAILLELPLKEQAVENPEGFLTAEGF
jgi:hypothetical protein